MFSNNTLFNDVIATALSGGIALSLLGLWEETAKRGIFDQNLNRKIVHVTVGLVFMLCWPMFSNDVTGAALAALIPGVNIIKMLLLGFGIWKDEKTVKSMSRFGDHRHGRYCGEEFRKSETSLQQQQNHYWHCRHGNCWFLGLHRVKHIASGARNISQNLLGFLLMENSKQIHVLFLFLWLRARKPGDDYWVLDRVPCFCSC